MKRVETRTITIRGPAGGLEAVVEMPADSYTDAAAVVCHPHPVYHGTMNNKVVHTVARAVNRMHRPAVRFNFRGVGSSEGRYDKAMGETDDALAVVDWARETWPAAEIWLAGFSFGAYVALRAALLARPACLITIAPPVQGFPVRDQPRPACPWLVVQGERDELVDARQVLAWAAGLHPPPKVECMADSDHFFHGRLTRLGAAVTDFISASAPACEVA